MPIRLILKKPYPGLSGTASLRQAGSGPAGCMPVNTRTTGCLKKTTSVQSPSSGINEGNELITSTETGGTVEQPGKGTEGIGFGKARIESLTDGIFAFGMTLLVLGAGYPFAVETLANRPVSQILLSSIPDIILYIISFLILATFWVAHHTQFHHVRYIDRTLLWLNIIILMFVAFIPFSSSIAGVFPANPLAAGVLEVHLLVTGLLFHFQWRYITGNHRLVDPSLPSFVIRRGYEVTLIIPVLSCVGLALALFSVPYGLAVYILVPPLYYLRLIRVR